jgi:4-hydroxy-4-methyl-2-oxoglutarate aldolase
VGGLNPLAVELAAREGARVVWLPTVDAENEAHAHRTPGAKLPAWARMQDELRARGLPVWARFVRSRGAVRATAGTLDGPLSLGGATVRSGDYVVLDADGAVVVARERAEEVLQASVARERREAANRERFAAGTLSIDLYGLRDGLAAHLTSSPQIHG